MSEVESINAKLRENKGLDKDSSSDSDKFEEINFFSDSIRSWYKAISLINEALAFLL